MDKIANKQSQVVDWLTITCKGSENQNTLYQAAKEKMRQMRDQGNDLKAWKFKGYGGLQCQGYRWGIRPDSSILVLSGLDANENWAPALDLATNITRIDLAVTVRLDAPLPRYAEGIYETLAETPGIPESQRSFKFIKNQHGGETLYINSRLSDQYGRLYDKGRENPKKIDLPPGTLWRYEVEFKQDRANRIARTLQTCAKSGQLVDRAICETVQKWFFARGCPSLIYSTPGEGMSLALESRVTDDQATLDWLSVSVSPSVKRLCAKGKKRDVLMALGILGFDIASIR